jgi:ABC-type multidrug transport system fused ATPase/permease subunit
VLIGVPVVFLPIIIAGRHVRRLSRASQDRLAEVAAYIDETFHEIRTVQAYVHEPEDRASFGARVEGQFDTAKQRILVRAAMISAVILLAFGAIGVILWVGGNDVVAGRLSPGNLSAFVFYAVLVAGAVGAIAEVMGELQRAAGAAERLLELLATEPQILAPANPKPLALPSRGALSFENVSFRYPTRPDALLFTYPRRGHALARDFKWLGSHRYGILHLQGSDAAHLRHRAEAASDLLGWPAPYADRLGPDPRTHDMPARDFGAPARLASPHPLVPGAPP